MGSIIIGCGIGVCVALSGFYMLVSGNCSLLHSYHYATTPAAERPILAREVGASLVACGVSVALIVPTVLPGWVSVIGVVLLVAGLVGMFAAIVRHNGGLVTFAPNSSWPLITGQKPWVVMLACTIIGIALSLIGFVPGIHMIATGDVSSLHDYHYVNVAPADIPLLARAEGICMIGLGVSFLICMVGFGGAALRRPAPRWSNVVLVAGVIVFAASLAGALGAIVYYNGSLMG